VARSAWCELDGVPENPAGAEEVTPEASRERANLLPLAITHYVVTSGRWLLHMRTLAGLGVLLATWLATGVLGVGLPTRQLYLTGAAILGYNGALWMWLGRPRANGSLADLKHRLGTHLQMALDWLTMAVLIMLTGGVESPIIFFFAFHIIIASLLFPRAIAAAYAGGAVVLVTALVWLEAVGVIPHQHVHGFLPGEAAAIPAFVIGVLGTFALMSVVTFYLTSSIAEQIRRREGQIATLYQGAQAITSTLELNEVLDRLVEATVTAMGVQGASIGLVDTTGTRIDPAASFGLSEAYLNKGPLMLDGNFVQTQVLASGEPTIIQTDEDRRRLQYPAAVAAEGIRSILYVRLPGKSRPLGLMRAYSSRSEAFGPDDVHFLTAIAAQGAAAIENAIAYQTLLQLDADKSRFVRMVTHELRSPVNGAQSLLSLILEGYSGDLTVQQREIMVRLRRRMQTLQSLINDLLNLAAGRSGLVASELKPVPLLEVLRHVVAQAEPQALEKHQTLALKAPEDGAGVSVAATPEWLDRIFSNLVGNAVKYTRDGGAVVVTVHVDDGHVAVEVADTGIGVPAKSLPRLFTEFYRAPNAKAFETGTGLGLVIVRELVEKLGGRIGVESQEGEGSTFTVRLPLAAQ
jgi:signal transduction histidine kinase